VEEKERELQKGERRASMVKKLSLAAAVLAMVVGLFAPPCHAVMYRYVVPDVRKMPPAQAERTLKDKGYKVIIVEIPAENITQVGKVMKQDPVGEYILIWDDWIGPITLSIATKGSFVPNTLAMTEAAAVDAVKKAGFTPGEAKRFSVFLIPVRM
jgi:beta-lactam-binding protein with PASTA domain